MKKFVILSMFLVLIGASVFGAGSTTGQLTVTGTIISNLSLTVSASAYTLAPEGKTKDTVSAMTVKSNAKTSFTLAVSTLNPAVSGSFVAKATVIGTASGSVVYWPYQLFLDDSVGGTNTELTPTSLSKVFTRKTTASGDAFTLQSTYASAESLNLDAGTYSDIITVTLTAN